MRLNSTNEMNDPNTKYTTELLLAFFNYQEYLVTDYTPCELTLISLATKSKSDPALVVNHFPNPYVVVDSELWRSTRIVRVPRAFDTSPYLYMVPQFSVYTPGKEPAAISSDTDVAVGEYDGSVYGTTSATPLVPSLLSLSELLDIVEKVNAFCMEAAYPGKSSAIDNVLDFFSATLYSRVFSLVRETHFKRSVQKLEKYVEQLNSGFLASRSPNLRLISPVKSAFLSLDFQIPRPNEF